MLTFCRATQKLKWRHPGRFWRALESARTGLLEGRAIEEGAVVLIVGAWAA